MIQYHSVAKGLRGLFLFWLLFGWSQEGQACLNFVHEWIPFASASEDLSTQGGYGLGEACLQFRKELVSRLASDSVRPDGIMLAGVSWGESPKPATELQIERVWNALERTWPASSVARIPGKMLLEDDYDGLASAAETASSPLSLTVHVAKYDGDTINLLDFIFFDLAIVRTVIRENVTATFRVLDRSGRLVYLNRLSVSPTIVFDVMFRPNISLLSYFEKHDSRPQLLDYGELFKNVASEAFEARPEKLRMPNIESSIEMETQGQQP